MKSFCKDCKILIDQRKHSIHSTFSYDQIKNYRNNTKRDALINHKYDEFNLDEKL